MSNRLKRRWHYLRSVTQHVRNVVCDTLQLITVILLVTRLTHRQVPGWVQEDDEQRRRQAVVGQLTICFDAHQRLWEKVRGVVTGSCAAELMVKVESWSCGTVPGLACRVWTAQITTPVLGAASLWTRRPTQTTEEEMWRVNINKAGKDKRVYIRTAVALLHFVASDLFLYFL